MYFAKEFPPFSTRMLCSLKLSNSDKSQAKQTLSSFQRSQRSSERRHTAGALTDSVISRRSSAVSDTGQYQASPTGTITSTILPRKSHVALSVHSSVTLRHDFCDGSYKGISSQIIPTRKYVNNRKCVVYTAGVFPELLLTLCYSDLAGKLTVGVEKGSCLRHMERACGKSFSSPTRTRQVFHRHSRQTHCHVSIRRRIGKESHTHRSYERKSSLRREVRVFGRERYHKKGNNAFQIPYSDVSFVSVLVHVYA